MNTPIPLPVKPLPEADEWASANPAAGALLDHLAELLAEEYIRLMKSTASEGEKG